jgi:hypothetical protein
MPFLSAMSDQQAINFISFSDPAISKFSVGFKKTLNHLKKVLIDSTA